MVAYDFLVMVRSLPNSKGKLFIFIVLNDLFFHFFFVAHIGIDQVQQALTVVFHGRSVVLDPL